MGTLGGLVEGLEKIGEFEDLILYKSLENYYKQYQSVFDSNFLVFEDEEFKINLPKYKKNEEYDLWNLNRVVNRQNSTKKFDLQDCVKKDDNIVNFIVDTGIDVSHEDFEGRASFGGNFVDDEDTDGHSHGTHVAGIIGSKTFGVCRNANLVAVKVLNS